MKNIMIFISVLSLISCNKSPSESIKDDLRLKDIDPVIQKFSKYGFTEKAPPSYSAALGSCTPPLGIYLLTPESGPFAGIICEIYRYEKQSDVSGPCGEEFVFKYEENTLQGQKFIDCPNDGSNCYTFQGPTSCVIVYCDENEAG